MKTFLISIVILVYFTSDVSIALRVRDRIDRANEGDESLDKADYVKKRSREKGPVVSNDELDDVEEIDRQSQPSESSEVPSDIVDEFQADLTQIRRFAQGIRPLANNMRRSMSGRREMGLEKTIILNIVKATLISIINAIEGYVPLLKPVTKYMRKAVTKIMSH